MPIGKNDFHSFESSIAINTEMSKCKTSRILFFIISIFFFNNHKRLYWALLVIFFYPHGLYWACSVVRGKRAMKERIREAQRVFKGYIE